MTFQFNFKDYSEDRSADPPISFCNSKNRSPDIVRQKENLDLNMNLFLCKSSG